MATLTVQQAAPGGVALQFVSIAAGGDLLPNDGKTILIFKNTNSTTAITADTVKTVDGLAIADDTMTLATTDRVMGPFDPSIFNTAAGGVNLTYVGAGIPTTTVAAVSL